MIPQLHERVLIPYAEAKHRLQDGDLLQFRGAPWSPVSAAIRAVGRSPYSHSGMVARVNGYLECLEVREGWGGRITELSWQVEEYGAIDVYRPSPSHHKYVDGRWVEVRLTAERRAKMVRLMRSYCRPREYGYGKVFHVWLTHLPVVRWLLPIDTDDKENRDIAPFCSEAYCHACRLAYTDPVPNKPDWRTEPGDLTRSPLLDNYLFTLVTECVL